MASILNRRDKWYARVKWYESGAKWQKTKEVPLRTKSKVTARERLSVVNQVQDEIIELHYKGEKYTFPWMNEDGKGKLNTSQLKVQLKLGLNFASLKVLPVVR
jgi:hypothetical protein